MNNCLCSSSGSDKLTYEELIELRDQVDALPCKIPESELISVSFQEFKIILIWLSGVTRLLNA